MSASLDGDAAVTSPQPDAEALVAEARQWWQTDIIDIHPGEIALRGYPIEELIGNVGFVDTIWLMLRGELPSRAHAALFEAALVASVDHGPQAPSIAIARMAVTCGVPVNGAMASAINVLDDIHGGPGQQCMELYLEIDAEMEETGALDQAVDRVLQRWRDAGIRYVPGFGHRFHPLDPRTPRLLSLVDDAVAEGIVGGRFAAIGRAVADAISSGRAAPIPMNVDGVTAVIYCELGLPPELGRGVFILARSVGILAHASEQMKQGGRIKGPMPKSLGYTYTGPAHRPVPRNDDQGRPRS
ncbi:citryl-CoA lyase [Microbacterium sp. zg.Y625]|uniref:citryl-CoA lyase n=1 Tax=Microbacterium jiangjiandongii TaxID=3049071 RepID=UPI00214ACA80|nr:MULTISPECIES: citryl-CoA lyase [unclassified Microbacterium]MCR2794091.1 citryl-CoA lyase [Microbacterium sp. zg.Y625]MCR2816668.1 citryl-CoA lyase [Microbacterium sp. zg.Y843]WIM25704.1 citryl-CoA lyase [Microbacterium sp. zg-Y625]